MQCPVYLSVTVDKSVQGLVQLSIKSIIRQLARTRGHQEFQCTVAFLSAASNVAEPVMIKPGSSIFHSTSPQITNNKNNYPREVSEPSENLL